MGEDASTRRFDEVYRQYAPLVWRYLRSLGCPPQDAEDVTHDTFVKVLLHIDSFREESKFSVWLCRIARNSWLSQLRRQKRDAAVPAETEPSAWDAHWFEWLDLLERLPEPYGSVFLKRELGGWSYGELAREYGKTENWARVTFYRARVQLQKLLDERGHIHGSNL